MTDVEKNSKPFDHFELDRKIRGSFLLQSNVLELMIETMISFHLCQDEHSRQLLIGLVLKNLNFTNKIRIMQKIFRRDYPEFNQKYPNFEEKMNTIKKFRNLLAHSSGSYSEEFLAKGLNDRIVLGVYDDDGNHKEHVVTLKEVDEKNNLVREIMKILLEFQSTVWDFHKKKSEK